MTGTSTSRTREKTKQMVETTMKKDEKKIEELYNALKNAAYVFCYNAAGERTARVMGHARMRELTMMEFQNAR